MNKRYFIVPPGTLPDDSKDPLYTGEHHYIDLDSHPGSRGTGHRVLVMMDGTKEPHPDWQELPHLLDAETTLEHPDHVEHFELLKHLQGHDRKGRLQTMDRKHGGYKMAKVLETIHPLFRP